MFKIESLALYSVDNQKYEYSFSNGINFFVGKNSSGKTQFYRFIDFMFGASEKISHLPWYKDTLEYAELKFFYNGIGYELSRNIYGDVNTFKYIDEKEKQYIDINEYKDRLNVIFAKRKMVLEDIKDFTDEQLTYRTFTLFNFLGEKDLGNLIGIFGKLSNIKYSTKISLILNYIFNKHSSDIVKLKKDLYDKQKELRSEENELEKHEFIIRKVNMNLAKLNIKTKYDGLNNDAVLSEIDKIKNMDEPSKKIRTLKI